MSNEFQEIGHSGGKIIFRAHADETGEIRYQVEYTHSSLVPVALIQVYALPQGIAVESVAMGGIGHVPAPPSIPGCYPVFIASDSRGKFGHHCPSCNGYWRSGPWPNVCPYCAVTAPGHQFLSTAQKRYVHHYCKVLEGALDNADNTDVAIDMDAVADAAGKEGDKPSFYVSEESQQHQFTCPACDEFNDILGRYGYCSACGTRNDLIDFETNTVPTIRDRLTTGGAPETCVRDAVSAFDTLTAQYAKQLANLVPMTKARNDRLQKRRFHDFDEICKTFREWFDINMDKGMSEEERRFVALLFCRRHIYEHNGGEVDQKYLEDSGDTTVRLKQVIHESQENAHRLLGSLLKMARNLHIGFHELILPIPGPIKVFEDRKARIARYRERGD